MRRHDLWNARSEPLIGAGSCSRRLASTAPNIIEGFRLDLFWRRGLPATPPQLVLAWLVARSTAAVGARRFRPTEGGRQFNETKGPAEEDEQENKVEKEEQRKQADPPQVEDVQKTGAGARRRGGEAIRPTSARKASPHACRLPGGPLIYMYTKPDAQNN